MDYQQTLEYLFSLGRFGIKPGLERISAILQSLGNPQQNLKIIHIAGTNGKGSTASFLSSILTAAGYRTGLYTSPHLIDFTERIAVNGKQVSEDEVVELARRVIAVAPAGSTFFELVTAMAYLHFSNEKVNAAILEAGMGGRYDATNAGDGILSIITPVSLDHCQYLGDTVEAIAAEKAGIIKKGSSVVMAKQEDAVAEVIASHSHAANAKLYRYGHSFSASWGENGLSYRGIGTMLTAMQPGIGGLYQEVNAAAALCAAEILSSSHGFEINEATLHEGILNARWSGRMELVSDSPRVILDGAHNPAGSFALAASLSAISRCRLFLVAGVMRDKEVQSILEPILPLVDKVFAVAPAIDRALPSADLAIHCRDHGKDAVDAGNVSRGIELARLEAATDDLIVVCGSLFTVGEARGYILNRPCLQIRA